MDTIEKKMSLKKRFLAFFAAVAVLAGGVAAGVQAAEPGTVTIKSDQPGAELQILDANGNVVKQFTMQGKEQTFTDIPAGEGYKLHEVTPPEGYKRTSDWTFSVVPTHTEGTQVLEPARQLPTSVNFRNEGLPVTGAYVMPDGTPVFCVDANYDYPPKGNYTAQQLGNVSGLSRDQLLRILYVGISGNARNYASQFSAANDYDALTQFWIATQYAVTSYTNPNRAWEDYGQYLGSNQGLAEQIKAAANDTSIVVPEGSVAYLYTQPGGQPAVAASFPVVQQTQVNGEPTEISIVHEQSTTPPPPPPSSENGKVVIKKTDDQGNVLTGAKFQIKDQAGTVIKTFTSTGNDEFTLAPGTYVLQETEAPEGYKINGTGKYTFTIKPGTTGVVTPGQNATVTASGTTGGSIFVGTGHMEVANGTGLVFCVNPQAVFLWEDNGGNTYSYSVLGESNVDLNAFGTKNSAGARGWIAGAPSNVGLNDAKMTQVKKVLWATYNFAMSGSASADHTGIIAENIGTVNDKFKQAAVYQAAQVAIAEIVSPGSVNWNVLGDNNTTGNVKSLAQALIAAAQGQSAYFAAYSGYSIVYLQSDGPSTQNLVTPGSEVVELTVKNSKTPPPPPSEEKVKGKLIVKKVDGAGKFLKGAKFQIKDANGTVVKEFTTNGEAQEFWLDPGTYVVQEVAAPEGYLIKGNGKYTVTITADQLPMTQYVKIWNGGGDSGEVNGGYKVAAANTENWYPVYCLNVGMPNLNAGGANNSEFPASVGNITRDQALRILYVGQLGDARGYGKQIEAGNGLDKDTQWWMTTQYAINFYTNGQTSAYNKHGHYLTSNNMAIANKLIAAANDASIKIPEGTVARLYQHSPKDGREQQPMISASFPKTVEISVVNEEKPKNPWIGTTANDSETGKIAYADDSVTIVDTVKYSNLEKGKKYTLKGQLVKKSDKSVVVATAEQEFTPETEDGTVDVTFTFDGSALAGDSVVAFEELYLGSTFVTDHKDINDKGQTVDFPEVKTNASDKVDGDQVITPGETVTVVDKVTYSNLIVGKQYTVDGKLMDKATNKPLKVNGQEITASKTFKATEANGFINLEFTFDASALQGKTLVVFESLKYEGTEVAVHADINDAKQTVEFPEIKTSAKDGADNDKVVALGEEMTIVDTVTYTNLAVGKEYTVSGVLMDKATNKPLLVNGEKVTASTTFTPETADGTVDVTFTFDSTALQGETLVVFEKLYQGDKEVVSHEDINDTAQTVKVEEKPAIEKYVNKNVHKDIKIKEVFTYDILAYITKDADKAVITDTLNDVLQFKSAASEVTVVDLGTENNHKPYGTVSEDGTPVKTAKAEIDGQTLTVTIDPATAERGHWVKVTFDAKIKDGLEVEDVVPEYVDITDNNPVLTDEVHEGIPNKAAYTIYVGNEAKYSLESNTVTVKPTLEMGAPELQTTATDANDGDKVFEINSDATVKDVVKYYNLRARQTYTLKGKLVVKGTNGKTVVAEAEKVFTVPDSDADLVDGTVEMLFEFNTKGLEGKDLVVYEYLYAGNVEGQDVTGVETRAEHADDNDKGQTVTVKKQVTPTPTPSKSSVPKVPVYPRVKLPVTGLPKTGSSVAVGAMAALMLIGAGFVLVNRRRND